MKRNDRKQTQLNQDSLRTGLQGGLTVAAAVFASGSAWGEEEAEALPETVVEDTHQPAPRPASRPAPRPRPAPVPVVEDIPVIETDTLFQADTLSSPRYTQPLLDTPQSVQILTSELISDQGATTLRDALRNVSGISLQAGEGGAAPGDNLSIRGFSARSDFFVDGVRDFGSYSRDPFNLEQVEVAKGPAGSITGRGSTGGSINLVSKTAKLNDFVHSDLSLGTDDLRRGTLDINQAISGTEGSAFRINLMGHESDTPDRGAAQNSRWGVASSLAFGLAETSDSRLTLNFFHMEEDNVPDFGIPWTNNAVTDPRLTPFVDSAPLEAFDNFYGVVSRDFEETSTTMYTALYEHDITDDIRFRNQTRVGNSDRLSILTSPRFGSLNPATVRRSDRKDRDEESSIVANQSDFLASFDTGGIHHDAVVGFEFLHEEYKRFSLETDPGNGFDTDYFNPNPFDPVSGEFSRDGTGDRFGESDTFAFYAFDTMEITEWLEFTGGVRHERLETTSRGTDNAGDPTPNRFRVDEMTSGRAAVVLKPAENGSVYFAYGTSFNPSGELLVLNEAGRNPSTFDVEPEMARSYEIGTKWDIYDERLSLSAALFRTDKTNVRDIDPADPTRFTLTGGQRVEGFELGMSGEVTPWWDIYASFTHLKGEVTQDFDPDVVGKGLGNTPDNSFSLWNHLEFENGFFFGGGPVFIDERLNNVAGTRMSPAYWTVDAMAGYHVNENVTLRLNVSNLTDEDYIDRMSGGHFIPGQGRLVMFTTSLSF